MSEELFAAVTMAPFVITLIVGMISVLMGAYHWFMADRNKAPESPRWLNWVGFPLLTPKGEMHRRKARISVIVFLLAVGFAVSYPHIVRFILSVVFNYPPEADPA